MKFLYLLCIAAPVVIAADALEPYSQCGGLDWIYAWQCPSGHTCKPVGTDSAFPRYQCLPDGGSSVGAAFPYGQCGGQTWTGTRICTPGWTCTVQNAFFSTCVANAGYTVPPNSTPDLATPGSYCGETAVVRGYPSKCVPGYVCTGPLTYGYYLCLLDNTPVSTSTAVISSTLTTVVVTTIPVKTTSSTKTTTTSKVKTTKTTKTTKTPKPTPTKHY